MDPNSKKEFTGTDGTVGFISSWDSKNEKVGRGEQEILGIENDERVDYELRFYEPFEATDYAFLATESIDDGLTSVTWGFNGAMPFPMNLMLYFMDMEEMLGGDLEQGLLNLKKVLEKQHL